MTRGPDHSSHCHSDRLTAPGWDLRGAEEEVLRLRSDTCITMAEVSDLRQQYSDWFFSDAKTLE